MADAFGSDSCINDERDADRLGVVGNLSKNDHAPHYAEGRFRLSTAGSVAIAGMICSPGSPRSGPTSDRAVASLSAGSRW